MAVEITNEDYREQDWDLVLQAGHEVMSVIGDIAFHHIAAGEGWSPWAKRGDTAALAAEVRDHLDRVEEAVKKAKGWLAEAERPARLRAARREQAAQS